MNRPNILLILNDDMGFSDLGCYGGEVQTPNLDCLAERGLRFTQFYNTARCCPSRASLLTGLHPHQANVGHMMDDDGVDGYRGDLGSNTATIAEVLKGAGYATYMSGKWHITRHNDGPKHSWPRQRGFDRFFGTITGAGSFYNPNTLTRENERIDVEDEGEDFFYTDAISDQAVDYIKDHARERKQMPFFGYVAYTAPHWPLHAHGEDIAKYRGCFDRGWDRLRQERLERMVEMGLIDPSWQLTERDPTQPPWEEAEHRDWQARRMEVYAAQVTCMDRNIGRITDYLQGEGIIDNTVVIYQHDNGGCHVEYGTMRRGSWSRDFTTDGKKTPIVPGNIPGRMPGAQSTFQSYGYGWANASNTPFRLFKQYDHEGGTHSPLIVHWPDGMARKRIGKLAGEVCHVIDVMPTLLDIAGVSFSGQQPVPVEGRSFAPVLQGKRIPEHAEIFWGHNHGKAVLQGDWKLVSADRGPWELYHLKDDGTELHDLAREMPAKRDELKKLHAAWAKRTNLNLEAK